VEKQIVSLRWWCVCVVCFNLTLNTHSDYFFQKTRQRLFSFKRHVKGTSRQSDLIFLYLQHWVLDTREDILKTSCPRRLFYNLHIQPGTESWFEEAEVCLVKHTGLTHTNTRPSLSNEKLQHTEISNLNLFVQIRLSAKLIDYFLWSNKSIYAASNFKNKAWKLPAFLFNTCHKNGQ